MVSLNRSHRDSQQKKALSRIKELFSLAQKAFPQDSSLSDKYVAQARRISMHYKVRIPSHLKRKFCSHCHAFLVPGVNCRLRTTKSRLVYYCFNCRHYQRFSLSKKR